MVIEILMTIDEFLQAIKKTAPPAPTHKLAQLEVALGVYCLTITEGSCRHATAAALVAPSDTKDLLHRIRDRSKADCRRMIKRRSTANPAGYIVQF